MKGGELHRSCDFKIEYELLKQKRHNWKQTIRYGLLIANILTVLNNLRLFPAWEFLVFFSNWGLIMATLSIFLTIKCAEDQNTHSKLHLLACNHILFEVSFLSGLIINGIYWNLIYPAKIKEETRLDVIFQMWTLHLVPWISTLANFFITDIIFLRRHRRQIFWIGFTYVISNLITTKMRGKPAYTFMTWSDPLSYMIAFSLVVIAVLVFNLFVLFSEILKGRKTQYKTA